MESDDAVERDQKLREIAKRFCAKVQWWLEQNSGGLRWKENGATLRTVALHYEKYAKIALSAADLDEFLRFWQGGFSDDLAEAICDLDKLKIDTALLGLAVGQEFQALQITYSNEYERFRRRALDVERDSKAAQEQLKPTIVAAVGSDVHLGTTHAAQNQFFEWLDQRTSGEEVVLLGDILDLYLYTNRNQTISLVDRVEAQWETLWTHLDRVAQRGVVLHYVPGNHDFFTFLVEAYDHVEWARIVVDRVPELLELHEKTSQYRLSTVVTLHYPFFELTPGNARVLLTHGHYARWGWRLAAGIPEGCAAPLGTFLTSLAVALAHKHAVPLRRLNNEKDWLFRAAGIEDAGIAVTNAILVAYEGAEELARTSQEKFAAVLDKAVALHFGQNPRMSKAEKYKILDSLLALHHSQGMLKGEDSLSGIWTNSIDMLSKYPDDESVTLHQQPGTPVSRRPFKSFLTPDKLVVGHYHVPRQGESVYDVGGFVGDITTWLAIQNDGTIARPI